MNSTTDETTALEQTSTEKIEQSVDTPETYEVDGTQVTLEDLKGGYLRQSDYTKKTKELAEERKSLEASKEVPEEVKTARDFLKEEGVITKKDLEKFQAQQKAELDLNELIRDNPDLKPAERAIRQLGETSDMAWEDIIVK